MKTLKHDFLKIYQTERGIIFFMLLNLVLSAILLIFTIVNLSPSAATVKVSYGDIGGYRDGSWTDMIAFPILAIVFGLFHNLLALRIFHKRGSGMTKFFLITTTALIAGAFIVFRRLLGEG